VHRLARKEAESSRVRLEQDELIERDGDAGAHGLAHTATTVSSNASITSVRVFPAASAS
jgi:hypothetical protein